MERIKRLENTPVTVIREDLIVPQPPAEIDAAQLRRLEQALTAAASNLDDAREVFETLCCALPDSAADAVRSLPVLLTVRDVCKLLGYHKTKVYDLMKRGLLPFVVETKTGHRRIEYRALQQLVKRLRAGHLERRAS